MTNILDSESRLFVNALARAFQVLEAFKHENRPLGFSEVVQASGLNRSVVQRILYTLKTTGYLDQHLETRKYSLSARMLSLSQAALSHDVVKGKALPFLKRLNQRTGETVNLMTMEGDEIVYVARFPSQHAVSVDLRVGSRLPVFCTAAGRAILAYVDPTEARKRLERTSREKMTAHTVTELDELENALAKVRELGYALNNQEAFVGDISIASPLFNEHGDVVAAVNVAVPFPRWELEVARSELAPQVVETAKDITQALMALDMRDI